MVKGVLDKQATSFDDVFDAFRLAMKYYQLDNYLILSPGSSPRIYFFTLTTLKN